MFLFSSKLISHLHTHHIPILCNLYPSLLLFHRRSFPHLPFQPRPQLHHRYRLHHPPLHHPSYLLSLLSSSSSPPSPHHSRNPIFAANSSYSIVLPYVMFVAKDEDKDQNVVVGLDQVVIDSYSKFPFSKSNTHLDSVFLICLDKYKDSEMLRMYVRTADSL
ncbi:hypothetical protein PVL29_025796 [Vitis rotundifolia]|uniref:Uncharacterized protein n=1 Tax=Vitis rotundifolia TaxID=103349 RepID=A0AA38YKY2_VITRO|nr:hypothetical protein PVL29_025796 [Vitis rotundifolia]